MEIRMTNTAINHIDKNVFISGGTSLELVRLEIATRVHTGHSNHINVFLLFCHGSRYFRFIERFKAKKVTTCREADPRTTMNKRL
jgi:hypothetical protein